MSKSTITKKQIKFLDNNRIYIQLVLVLVFMCLFAPKFLGLRNFTTILRSTSMNALAAIGFSIVLICGQLDLSLGSAISLGAVFTVGFRLQFSALDPTLAWSLGFLIAIAAGAVVGLINGLLVTKAKITSFIVTLGMMITVQGVIYMYTDISLSATQEVVFVLSDFLRAPMSWSFGLITPRVLISAMAVGR